MIFFYITDREIYEKGKNKTIDREQKVLFNTRINKNYQTINSNYKTLNDPQTFNSLNFYFLFNKSNALWSGSIHWPRNNQKDS